MFMFAKRTVSRSLLRRHLTTHEVVYSNHGNPQHVLSLQTRDLDPITPTSLHLQFLASPINPSDINQIQGVYPIQPRLRTDQTAVGGNEGVARIIAVGDVASKTRGFQVGDWVVPAIPALGTWRTFAHVEMDHVMAFDKRDVSIEQAAVMNVNPGTAYRMLQDFAELTSGDWVIQNGANSAVGQAVIQLARERNIKTFNVVRQQSLDKWYTELKALGADEVVSDEALRSAEIRELLGYVKPRLGFNCVGGKSATEMARALGDKGVLVTYGGMSREPVTLPTSVFIFRDVRAVGYWQSRWSATATLSERQQLLDTIADKYREGVLDVPLGLVSREWAHIEQHGISGVMEEAMASHGKQLIVFP